jgi:hypothetical protein
MRPEVATVDSRSVEVKRFEWGSVGVGIVGVILAGVQVWDILDRRGMMDAAVAVVVWLIAFGMIAFSVYRSLKDAHRGAQLRSEIVTIKDDHRIHIKALEKQLTEETEKAKRYFHDYNEEVQSHQETKAKEREANTFKDQASREIEKLKAKPTIETEDPKAALVRNASRLWVEYKAATKNPTQMEALVFSKDGNSPVRNIQIGPLVWNVTETRPISLHNVIGVLRSEPIECRFTAYEQIANRQRIFQLPEVMREMMRKFGVTAQPIVEVSYEDLDGTVFVRGFILSLDPDNRIVWEPSGPLLVR